MSSDQHVVTRNLPSVQTRITGDETIKAIVQAFVLFVALGIALTALYWSIYSVMTVDRWRFVFAGSGYLIGLAAFIKFWSWQDGLEGDSQFPRITAWLGNVFVNSWPWGFILAYEAFIVPLLIAITSTAPHIVTMFIWVASLLIAVAFLVYRIASELFDPLAGNAIEIVTLKINVAFEKWKINHNESVSALKNKIARLESQLEQRDKLIATLQGIKNPTADLSKSIWKMEIDGRLQFGSYSRNKRREIDPALFARFILDGMGGIGFKRADWDNIGVGKDDWTAMTNALKPWALDGSNQPIMTTGKVMRELLAYGIPLPSKLADVPQNDVRDVGTGQGHPVNQAAGG